MGQRLHLDPARVVDVVGSFANTSAASLPIALAAAQRAGRLHDGDVLLAAFGARLVRAGRGDPGCAGVIRAGSRSG